MHIKKRVHKFHTKKKAHKSYTKKKSIIEELASVKGITIEALLQDVKTQEEELASLPILEDHLAEVERLTEEIKRDLEEYLRESS